MVGACAAGARADRVMACTPPPQQEPQQEQGAAEGGLRQAGARARPQRRGGATRAQPRAAAGSGRRAVRRVGHRSDALHRDAWVLLTLLPCCAACRRRSPDRRDRRAESRSPGRGGYRRDRSSERMPPPRSDGPPPPRRGPGPCFKVGRWALTARGRDCLLAWWLESSRDAPTLLTCARSAARRGTLHATAPTHRLKSHAHATT